MCTCARSGSSVTRSSFLLVSSQQTAGRVQGHVAGAWPGFPGGAHPEADEADRPLGTHPWPLVHSSFRLSTVVLASSLPSRKCRFSQNKPKSRSDRRPSPTPALPPVVGSQVTGRCRGKRRWKPASWRDLAGPGGTWCPADPRNRFASPNQALCACVYTAL